MASDMRNRSGGELRQRRFASAGWRLLASAWPYILAIAALLGASELLWLWHSWPVRELLDTELVSLGAAL